MGAMSAFAKGEKQVSTYGGYSLMKAADMGRFRVGPWLRSAVEAWESTS